MDMNVMMQYVTYGLAALGVLAFMVSIVVQTIKELPKLNKIPTSIVALVTSLILCPVAVVVMCTYYKIVITLYYYLCFISGRIYCLSGSNRWLGESKRHLGPYKI